MYNFNEEEINRYSRHILLKDVGVEGQEKICNAKVLVVGAGGLGSPAILYLAAAGIGTIGIIDADVVDLSNLQRQIIHTNNDVGHLKALSAKKKINALNPNVKTIVYQDFLRTDNALHIINDYDFVIDGTDNFPAKYLVNDACVMAGKPFSHGSVFGFEGQVFTHIPGSCCYRCIYREPPEQGSVPSCAQAGVLGAVVGILGTIQATETLKYFTSVGELLTNKLLVVNTKTMNFLKISIEKDSKCSICGNEPNIRELIDYKQNTCEFKKH
ncbi:MAG: HesA/MoeB/ThiF family protein [Bacteroidales bacterium]|nr:HesA/MoeB/ThiF family protein [Bacteroidales bacterium]